MKNVFSAVMFGVLPAMLCGVSQEELDRDRFGTVVQDYFVSVARENAAVRREKLGVPEKTEMPGYRVLRAGVPNLSADFTDEPALPEKKEVCKMEKFVYRGNVFDAWSVETPHGVVLLVRAPQGMLGCGYFSTATADKLGDALAVVSGVKTFEDMVRAEVKNVSAAAAEKGVAPGMTGGDALLKML